MAMKCVVQGRILQTGFRQDKNKNDVAWTDVYLENCGETVRVHRWGAPNHNQFDQVTLCINVYNGSNGLYTTYDSEGK